MTKHLTLLVHRIFPILLLIVGCSTDFETLQNRGDVYYEINAEKPFRGSVIEKYESGQKLLKGNLKDGKKDGLWIEWYENGHKRSEINHTDGKRNGLGTWWYEDGKVSYKGMYKNGNPIDGWTYYQRDGTTIEPIVFSSKVIYKDGLFVSIDNEIPYSGRVLTVYDIGQKEWEVTYKDGIEDGLVNQWYDNGQKQLEVTFKDKKPFGVFMKWNEDGSVKND